MFFLRLSLSSAAITVLASGASAATPKEIDAAIQSGSEYLRDLYKSATPKKAVSGTNGLGAAALGGLALLETGTSADDPALRAITAGVRDAAVTAAQTYHIALAILYLDRLGDSGDVPLIQLLGLRLLAGQSENGGWGYECIEPVAFFDERDLRSAISTYQLRTVRPAPATGGASRSPVAASLSPEVAKYQNRLAAVRIRPRITDNSNTQFAVLGVWVARKHGVPCDAALDAAEKRFLSTQTSGGGWPYAGSNPGSPSMTCAGLLGLATGIGRREGPAKPGGNSPRPAVKPVADDRDRAVQKAMASLGSVLAGNGRRGHRFNLASATPGDRDLYFLWSVERVGVLYGLDQIGGVDWYDVGADEIVGAQNLIGSWGRGGRGAEVDTAFALLFLARANQLRDLSAKLSRGPAIAELRTGGRAPLPKPMGTDNPSAPGGVKPPSAAAGGVTPPSAAPGGGIRPPSAAPYGTPPNPSNAVKPSDSLPELPNPNELRRTGVTVIRPNKGTTEDPKKLAAAIAAASDAQRESLVSKARDAKGSEYTQALVLAANRLDGERLKAVRQALADRLARMTAETLRPMAKSDEMEQRRAVVLAMAMKEDKTFVPDLVNALLDDEDVVIHAARAGLKSLTGQDFGPAPASTAAERKAAVAQWKKWMAERK